jgi:hypothetical protein
MYEAYSDYESMMNLAEEIVTRCAMATLGKLKVDYQVMTEYILLHYVNELDCLDNHHSKIMSSFVGHITALINYYFVVVVFICLELIGSILAINDAIPGLS